MLKFYKISSDLENEE